MAQWVGCETHFRRTDIKSTEKTIHNFIRKVAKGVIMLGLFPNVVAFPPGSKPPMSDNAFSDYRDNFTIIQYDAIYRDNIAIFLKR